MDLMAIGTKNYAGTRHAVTITCLAKHILIDNRICVVVEYFG